MITILTALLLTNPLPPLYCEELRMELREAVIEGWVTNKEARDIYKRCLNTTAPAS